MPIGRSATILRVFVRKKKKKSFLLFGSNVDYYCQSEVSEYESADSLLVKGVQNGKLRVSIAKV